MPEDRTISKVNEAGEMTEVEKKNKRSNCPNRYRKIFPFYKINESLFYAEKCKDYKTVVVLIELH